jgi:erythromycin esterase-like protein
MPRRSAEPRYRRRVVLELTPDESDLLDRLADSHGTIRGAVLAGLTGLETNRAGDLEAQVRKLSDTVTSTKAALADERAGRAADLGAAKKERTVARDALKGESQSVRDTKDQLREARTKLAEQTTARRAADELRKATQWQLFHNLYCSICQKMAPEAEWAEESDGQQGAYSYHQPHGFRLKPSWGGLPTVLGWRARPPKGGAR